MSRSEAQGRCTGHCCKAFALPVHVDQLRAHPERWHDGKQIADMVEYLGFMTPAQAGVTLVDERGAETPCHFYSCTNLLENGDCGIYETRPRMCSGYPYDQPCSNAACTAACPKTTDPGVSR